MRKVLVSHGQAIDIRPHSLSRRTFAKLAGAAVATRSMRHAGNAAEEPQKARSLFDGRTLDGWIQIENKPTSLSRSGITGWIVKDGAMSSTGSGRGVIYTANDYSHFGCSSRCGMSRAIPPTKLVFLFSAPVHVPARRHWMRSAAFNFKSLKAATGTIVLG